MNSEIYLRAAVSNMLITIILIVAVVVITGLLIWAAVALKAIQTQQEIMKNINKDWIKFNE